MVSMVTVYLFLHILGAFMIVGGSTLGEGLTAGMKRSTNAHTLLALSSVASRIPMMTVPGALLAIIFGTLMIPLYGFSHSAIWINISYTLWIISAVLSVAVLGPAMRNMHALAQRDAAAGTEASAELLAAVKSPRFGMTVHTLSLLVLIFLVLMVFKPGN
ncbi:MAG: DUF2269 family protein [Chloroflexi bacterium]|nr:MAG: DUF2269 family protein [Chloroflexota bacterium]